MFNKSCNVRVADTVHAMHRWTQKRSITSVGPTRCLVSPFMSLTQQSFLRKMY